MGAHYMAEIIKKKRKVVLLNFLSPGDVVVMTATVRDLHRKYPGEFITDVHTSAPEIWENNPYITKLPFKVEPLNGQTEPAHSMELILPERNVKIIKDDPEIEIIDTNYGGDYPASINRSNTHAYHFLHGYAQDISRQLGVDIPITDFKGDIHISEKEKSWMSQLEEMKIKDNFWIMMAGGKMDFTAKWWDPLNYQKVVDAFKGKVLFAQCGERTHFHPALTGVVDLIGKTNIRQFIRLVYHADGVVCGVTFAMHLAAAVPIRTFDNKGRRKSLNRACVVIAGGREGMHWEAYPHHQYIHLNGALPCCAQGGCWKSRCHQVGDGDPKDRKDLCLFPVKVADNLNIPRCMKMITPDMVTERIKFYYDGGAFQYYGED